MPHSRTVYMFIPLFLAAFAIFVDKVREESSAWFALSGLYLIADFSHLNPQFRSVAEQEVEDADHMYSVVGSALNNVWIDGDVSIPEAGGRISYVMKDKYS